MSAIRINILFSFSSICSIETSSRGISRQRSQSAQRAQFQDALQAQPVHLRVDNASTKQPQLQDSACAATHPHWKDSASFGHDQLWAECQTSVTTTVQQVLDGDKKRIVSTLSGSRLRQKSLHMKPGRLTQGRDHRGRSSTGWQSKSWRLIPGGGNCRGSQRVSGFDQFGRHLGTSYWETFLP